MASLGGGTRGTFMLKKWEGNQPDSPLTANISGYQVQNLDNVYLTAEAGLSSSPRGRRLYTMRLFDPGVINPPAQTRLSGKCRSTKTFRT